MVNRAKSRKNKINEEHSDKQQMKLNEQTFENQSIMSELNNALKLNPLKIFVVFFLVIIIYIVACEMIQYGYKQLQNMPKGDIDLYRFLQILCCIMIIFSGIIAIYCLIIFLCGLFLYVTDNFIPLCVRYWYVEGKQSYRWWQTKSAISFIVGSFTIILWMIFAVKFGQLLLFDFAFNDMSNDRLIVYRISGLVIITLLSIVYFVGVVFKKDRSYSNKKHGKAQ